MSKSAEETQSQTLIRLINLDRTPRDEVKAILQKSKYKERLVLGEYIDNRKKQGSKFIFPLCKPETSPFLIAVAKNNTQVLDLFLKFGITVHVPLPGSKGTTLAHVVAEFGMPALMNGLKGIGAKLDAKDENGTTPLYTAVRCLNVPVIRMLLDSGCSCLSPWGDKNSVIELYINMVGSMGQLLSANHITKLLEEACIKANLLKMWPRNLNLSPYMLFTVLQCADDKPSFMLKVIKILLKHGCETTAKDRYSNYLIDYVCGLPNPHRKKPLSETTRSAILDLLLKQSKANGNRSMPLVIAMTNFSDKLVYDVIEKLLENGYDPNSPLTTENKFQVRALHYACGSKKIPIPSVYPMAEETRHKIVNLLLLYGADVNMVDDEHNTPLHIASQTFHPKIVELLLYRGAETTLTNVQGLRAEDVPIVESNESKVKVLSEIYKLHQTTTEKGDHVDPKIGCKLRLENITSYMTLMNNIIAELESQVKGLNGTPSQFDQLRLKFDSLKFGTDNVSSLVQELLFHLNESNIVPESRNSRASSCFRDSAIGSNI